MHRSSDESAELAGALADRRTARLLLQKIAPCDLPDIERMQADPETMATLGGVRDAAVTRRMFEDWSAHWHAHGFGLWSARDAATGAFAGRGGLKHCVVGGRPEVEVVYGFLPSFWGRGLATELAEASVRAGFAELRLGDLVCFTLTTNRASQRVMEKAGFVFERTVEHAGLPHVVFRLRAMEWRDRAK
jgi:RimJ/RimL family protein N-acetyltransferase